MRYKLNKEQERAVKSNADRILCLAGAGTGKTRTMIERIVRLVNDGVNPSAILALTFTNAAAFEMKSRYHGYIQDGITPEVRTFHSYCYDLLTRDVDIQKHLGYSSIPKIADEKMCKRIDREAALQSGISIHQKKMDDPSTMSLMERKNYDILMKCRHRLMKQKNLITFDELCTGICNLFIDKNPLIEQYRGQIQYLCVDEYQDTDPIQHDFAMSFDGTAKIFVVGDALQSIYSFRGAVPEIIKSLSMDPRWELVRLSENYRSTKNICNFANEFSQSYADESYRTPIESDRAGDVVDIRNYSFYSYDSIFKRIAVECKCLTGTVAIIARTNKECDDIREQLDKNEVKYSVNHKNVDAKYILPSVTDSEFLINWLATFLPSEQYSEFIRESRIKSTKDAFYTERQFIATFGLNPDIKMRTDAIYEIRTLLKNNNQLDYVYKEILRIIGYPKLCVDLSEVTTVSDLFSKILDAVANQPDQDADVYVGTIHSVKGLEYDTVYIMGVNGTHFKLTTEENKNVYYVGMTRAKKRLIIYS